MANGSDGSIIIDTELDNSGAEKGADKLLEAVKEVTAQIKTSGEAIQQSIASALPAFENLAGAVDNLGDNMMTSFSQVIPLLQTIAATATQTNTAVAESATQAADANSQVVASEQQAAQAAQATAAAMNQQNQSMGNLAATAGEVQQNVSNAGQSATAYDKELAKLQTKIDAVKTKLAEYYKEKAAIESSTDADLARANTSEQVNNVLAIEDMQLQGLNAKYASQLTLLQNLEAEFARLSALKAEAANNPDLVDAKTLTSDIQKAAAEVDKYQAKVDKMSTLGATDKQWQSVQYDIDMAGQKLEQYRASLEALKASGGISTADYEHLSGVLDTAAAKQSNLTNQLQPSAWQTFGAILKNVAASAGRMAASLAKASFKAIANGVKAATKKLKSFCSQTKKTALTANGLAKALTSVRRLLIGRIKRMFISAILNGVKEGMQSLAQFSASFNTAMSNIKNSAKELSGNLAVSFGGLIQAIEPVLTYIINAISTAISYLNAFFAMLSGKSAVTVAKKQMDSYAESTAGAAGAAEDLKKQVYGFDQLNKRSDDSGGGGGGSDASDLYEEVPIDALLPDNVQSFFESIKSAFEAGDWHSIGSIIAGGLNAAVAVVDEWIVGTLRPLGVTWAGNIANLLNGLTSGFDWGQMGKTIADGANTVFDTLNTFLTTYDFSALGQGIANAVNGLFDNIEWDLLGQTFANKWNALIDSIYGIVSTLDWASIGTSLSDMLTGYASSIKMDTLAESIGLGLNGIFTTIQSFVTNTNWGSLATQVSSSINTLFATIDWAGIMTTFVEGFNGIISFLATVISTIDWAAIGTDLAESLTALVTTIDWGSIGTLLTDAVVALLDLLLTLVGDTDWGALVQDILAGIGELLANIDWGAVLARIGALVVELVVQLPGIIVGALGGISDLLGGLFEGFGLDAIAGFFYGIGDAMADAGAWLKENVVDPVVNWVKDLFGIHSPSTVFAEIGDYLIQGMLSGISNAWTAITDFFSDAVSGLSSFLSDSWEGIKSTASTAWEGLKTGVSGIFNSTKTALSTTANNIRTGVSNTWENVKSKTSAAWENVKAGVTSAFDNAKASVSATAENIRSGISDAWENVKSKTSEAWENVKSAVTSSFNNTDSSVSSTAEKLKSDLTTTWNNVKTTATTTWNNVKTSVTSTFNNMKSAVSTAANNLKSSMSSTWSNIKSTATTTWNNIKSAVSSSFTGLKSNLTTTVNGIKTTVTEKFNGLKSTLQNVNWSTVGSNICTGIQNGINAGWSWLSNTVSNLAKNLLSKAKSALGIHSPSRLFREEVGKNIGLGMAEGITDTESDIVTTVSNLAQAMSEEMSVDPPALATPDSQLLSGLDQVATRLTGIAEIFQRITNALTAIGGFRMPQIAAGTVVPAKTKIDTSTPANTTADAFTSFTGDVDERLADITYQLKQLIAIVKALNLNIDINALTDMLTQQQYAKLRNFGGV